MVVLWVILAAVVVAFGFVRLSPVDPAVWHVSPPATENKDFKRGVIRVIETGPDGLARLHMVAQAAPRTKVLAGSVADGMVTYVTRTAVFGFPDFTTAQQQGDSLVLYARLRFGRSDFGVNGKRVERWIDAFQP